MGKIAWMGFRNLPKSLKGEEGFFKSNSCKSENDKVKWLGKFIQKWTLIPLQLGTGEYVKTICMKVNNQ